MASTDARPLAIKNTAYRCVFPILDADGDLVTGAAGLDSEISKDQGTFADCSNEATEIATSSGMYYLDLTSTEMNADCVAVVVKTSTTGAKTTPMVFYPQEAGDVKVDVQTWLAGTIPAVNVTGVPLVDLKYTLGTISPAAAGSVRADSVTTPSDSSGVTTLLSRLSATRAGYLDNLSAGAVALEASLQGLITTVGAAGAGLTAAATAVWAVGSRLLTGAVSSVTGAVGSVTGSVGSVSGNVGGNVVGTVGSVVGAVGSVTAAVTVGSGTVTTVTDLTSTANAEPTAPPAATAAISAKIAWLFVLARNKVTQTATTQLVKANDDTTTIGSSTVADDGTTFSRTKFT